MPFPPLFHLSAAGLWGVQVTEFTEIGLLSLTHPFSLFPSCGHGTWSHKLLEYGPSLLMPMEQTSAKLRVTPWAQRGASHWHQHLGQPQPCSRLPQWARGGPVLGGKWLGNGGNRRWKGPCCHHGPHMAFSNRGETWRSTISALGPESQRSSSRPEIWN